MSKTPRVSMAGDFNGRRSRGTYPLRWHQTGCVTKRFVTGQCLIWNARRWPAGHFRIVYRLDRRVERVRSQCGSVHVLRFSDFQ